MKRTPLRAGLKPLKRTPLSGSARTPARQPHKPMKRGTPLKVRRVSKRFAARRDRKYCAWVRTMSCLLTNFGCSGRVECSHVVSRGAGGMDVGNTLPMCSGHHRQFHRIGIRSFELLYCLDLRQCAANLAALRDDFAAVGPPQEGVET